MRGSVPVLFVLATGCVIATGCGAATPLQPAPPPRGVEVVPVHEEPPPPPPKPPPPPTLDEIATRMASALGGAGEGPAAASKPGGSSAAISGLFGGSAAPSAEDEAREVMVSFKVVSTTGKFIKDGLKFALDMHDTTFALCVVEARGGERKGTVTVSLAFDGEGAPVEPALKSSTFKEKNLTECIREGFRRIDPVAHTDKDPSVQANNRATVEVSLERPQGF